MRPARLLDVLDRSIAKLLRAAQWLIFPVVILLFVQWPLRDIVRSYSREANDLGQWIFALYVAASVTAATRAGSHLAADMLARRYRPAVRALIARCGAAFGLVPWALLVLVAGRNIVVSSVVALEAFPDTANPGYFFVKIALWLMAALVLAQAVLDLARPRVGIGA
ncbi:MAG TPA: TRAP transporter small permease subunit [Xanthobacteraceae bacterium]|nr:TRAP transporter small permease subunit [Xanthobacteraceae bacterium]